MSFLLTIAIPTYNRADLLNRALSSIFNQIDDRVEVLVSDNASTDNTSQIIERYKKNAYNLNYIYNEENIGSMRNFMQCYMKAQGEYVLLLGSDDWLEEGSLVHILDFLQNNVESKFIFLNHSFYNNQTGEKSAGFIEDTGDFATCDKVKFIDFTKQQITFMSCIILRRADVLKVENPERFFETHFLHTCLALSITKEADSRLGVITRSCIVQDITPGNAVIKHYFEVFAKWEKLVFCDYAVGCGYDKKQMNKLFNSCAVRTFPPFILNQRLNDRTEWKSDFWENGYPNIKGNPMVCIRVLSFIFMPKCILKIIKSVYKEIKKCKVKG